MKKILMYFYNLLMAFGFDAFKFSRAVRGLPIYLYNFYKYVRQRSASKLDLGSFRIFPCLDDRYSESGSARGHYFHQDLLVARRIFANAPKLHIDVGSRVDGFVAHVATFRKIEVLDIRKSTAAIPNITFIQCDVMNDLPDTFIGSCDSLSCLHALEHFGLGRYGDTVRYDGHLIGFRNLQKILRSGGKMYVSVPIGPMRVEYDAHRVFSVGYLLDIFSEQFRIDAFSYVDDAGDLFENSTLSGAEIETNFGCSYGCGIFELSKLADH